MSDELNTPGVWPAVLYDDPDAARVFLTDVLGFTETLTVRGDDGKAIVHAEVRWPEGGGLMYGTRDEAAKGKSGRPVPTGISWLYVVTADPDAVYRRAKEAGAEILREPYDTEYGSRDVGILDTEGNVWTFGTYKGS